MTQLTITKEDVLEALENEPLASGYFIDLDSQSPEDCSVCAVGATLRAAWLSVALSMGGVHGVRFARAAVDACDCKYSSAHTANPDNYLSALSIVWEYLNEMNDVSPEALRWVIWDWADENIPDDWCQVIQV